MKHMMAKALPLFLLTFFLLLACSESDNELPDEGTNPPPSGIDTSVNKKPVGESANDLLSDDQFNNLVIEILYVEGQQPTATAINNFKSFLESRLKKSSITIIQRNIGAKTEDIYSIEDIRSLEDNTREKYNTNEEIAVSGLFLNGEYSENTSEGKVLGVAYRNTSFALFEETIKDFSTGVLAPSQSTLENVVLNHEFGHILGLVNVGSPMQTDHQDVAHGKHCDNDECLMFWTAETGEGLVNMLSGGTVPNLDANCINDLKANGGK